MEKFKIFHFLGAQKTVVIKPGEWPFVDILRFPVGRFQVFEVGFFSVDVGLTEAAAFGQNGIMLVHFRLVNGCRVSRFYKKEVCQGAGIDFIPFVKVVNGLRDGGFISLGWRNSCIFRRFVTSDEGREQEAKGKKLENGLHNLF